MTRAILFSTGKNLPRSQCGIQ